MKIILCSDITNITGRHVFKEYHGNRRSISRVCTKLTIKTRNVFRTLPSMMEVFAKTVNGF